MILASLLNIRRPGSAAFVALVLPLLAACNVDRHEIVGSIPDDYRTRHPIVLEEGLATMDVPVATTQGPLPDAVRGNVAGFARGFRSSGSTMLAIVVPSGSPNATAAAATAGQVRQLLQAQGVPAAAIDMRLYPAGAKEANAAVRLAYSRVTAKTDPCGRWPDQTATTFENRNYQNFGCATQQNLAAMAANPLDLMYPRDMTPPDAEKRGEMLKNYRSGNATQSDHGAEGGSVIAKSVGQ